MKHVRKIFAFALTLVMAFAIALPAFADDGGEGGSAPTTTTTGTITINNAAKNETYEIYKVLNATISDNGGINYTGEIPSALQSVLEVQTVDKSPNTYSAIGKKADVEDDVYFKAIEDYAKTTNPVDSKQANGSGKVTFNVAPGYYVVTSTQGTHVMIDSATNPASEIYEKNTKTITAEKEVNNGTSFSIGDTITYTATFNTTNYYGEGDAAKIVSSYEISDTLPEFLSNVSVTSITIGGNPYTTGQPATTPQFDSNKTIAIPWATRDTDGNWTSLYNNGSQIVVVYTATLTSVTNINDADTNTVKIQPVLNDGTGDNDKPWDDSWQADAQIYTYAAALKKVDGKTDKALKGAKFTIKGLNVTGGNGIYTVVSYNAADATESAALDTDDNGNLYILGLNKDVVLTVTEVTAPDGYNKLTSTVTLRPQVLSKAVHSETTTVYYDAKGNIIKSETTSEGGTRVIRNLEDLNADALKVLNNKGTELPSTGGIGTTIFYVVGGIMVAGAAIFLLTKRRAAASE